MHKYAKTNATKKELIDINNAIIKDYNLTFCVKSLGSVIINNNMFLCFYV